MDKFSRLLKLMCTPDGKFILYWLTKGVWMGITTDPKSHDEFNQRILERSECLGDEYLYFERKNGERGQTRITYYLMPEDLVRAVRLLTFKKGE